MFKGIKGILCDLDGVVYISDQPVIEGIHEVFEELKIKGIKVHYLTNTTRVSRQQLLDKLNNMGIAAQLDEIVSPPAIAANYLKEQGIQNAYFCVRDDIKTSFKDFFHTKHGAKAVIVGDIGHKWSYGLMNTLFHLLQDSAVELIALHKNRFLKRGYGSGLDIGPFIAALEYACNREALVIGKPNTSFFDYAVQKIALPKESLLMVGDDLDSDIIGAQNAGIKAALVKTGKYNSSYASRSPIKPDFTISNIAELLNHIN